MKHTSREITNNPGTLTQHSGEAIYNPAAIAQNPGKTIRNSGTAARNTGTGKRNIKRRRLNPWRIALAAMGLCAILAVLVFAIGFAADRIIYKDINKSVTVEAGKPISGAGEFLKDPSGTAAFITDISKIDFNSPGVYPVKIQYNNKTYNVTLAVKDTTAPTGVIKELDLYDGETATMQDFVESIVDAQSVTVSYKTAPDFSKINSQPVILVLQDPSGNKTEYPTSLRISKLKKSITLEASSKEVTVRELLKSGQEAGTVAFVAPPVKLDHVGDFPVQASIDGVIYDSIVKVVDSVAPKGSAVSQTGWAGTAIEASSFVEKINDMTSVTVSFKTPPDFTLAGKQTVTIVLTDEGKNETVLNSSLTIKKDTTPPKIIAPNRVTVYIDQAIAYKKGVSAEDDKDGKVEVTVDSSGVNPKVEGSYTVSYSATDSAGNIRTIQIPVIVKKQSVDMATLEKLADEVLAKIITPNMSMREKAWAIYQYENNHLTYTGYSDKTDWMKEAYNGITKAVGDCFTYYSMSNLLLTRVGFDVLSVERASKTGEAKHYWHMVYCDGGWYHFDACIHKPKLVSFMLTDAQLDAYSALQGKDNYYYRFDRSKYPATPVK